MDLRIFHQEGSVIDYEIISLCAAGLHRRLQLWDIILDYEARDRSGIYRAPDYREPVFLRLAASGFRRASVLPAPCEREAGAGAARVRLVGQLHLDFIRDRGRAVACFHRRRVPIPIHMDRRLAGGAYQPDLAGSGQALLRSDSARRHGAGGGTRRPRLVWPDREGRDLRPHLCRIVRLLHYGERACRYRYAHPEQEPVADHRSGGQPVPRVPADLPRRRRACVRLVEIRPHHGAAGRARSRRLLRPWRAEDRPRPRHDSGRGRAARRRHYVRHRAAGAGELAPMGGDRVDLRGHLPAAARVCAAGAASARAGASESVAGEGDGASESGSCRKCRRGRICRLAKVLARANLQPAKENPQLAPDKPGAEGSRFLCA